MARVQSLQRFPVAGLPMDRRAAYWRGDFDEVRGSGLRHAAYDIFVVSVPATGVRYQGAAIVAPIDGTVLLKHPRSTLPGAGTSERGGNYVWMRGVDGYDYYFAHMGAAPLVQPGQSVVAGAQLGILGDSGNARGRPHLHFAVKTAGGSSVEAYDALHAVEATSHDPPKAVRAHSRSWVGPIVAAVLIAGAIVVMARR